MNFFDFELVVNAIGAGKKGFVSRQRLSVVAHFVITDAEKKVGCRHFRLLLRKKGEVPGGFGKAVEFEQGRGQSGTRRNGLGVLGYKGA